MHGKAVNPVFSKGGEKDGKTGAGEEGGGE